jgi:hypothetical protein
MQGCSESTASILCHQPLAISHATDTTDATHSREKGRAGSKVTHKADFTAQNHAEVPRAWDGRGWGMGDERFFGVRN